MIVKVKLVVDYRNKISSIQGGDQSLLLPQEDPIDGVLGNHACYIYGIMEEKGYVYDPEKPFDEMDYDLAIQQGRVGNVIALNFVKEVPDSA